MEEKITLQQIVDALAEKNGISKKKADALVRTMFEVIQEALSEEKYVKIKGLGTFKLTEVDSRESVDVNTGERIEIGGHVKVSFTPDTAMKELINKPFAHFQTVILNEHTQLDDTEVVDYKEVLSEDDIDMPVQEEREEKATNTENHSEKAEIIPQQDNQFMQETTEVPASDQTTEEESIESLTAEVVMPAIQPEVAKADAQDKESIACEKLKEPANLDSVNTDVNDDNQKKHANTSLWKGVAIGLSISLLVAVIWGVYVIFAPSEQPATEQVVRIIQPKLEEKTPSEVLVPKDTIKGDTLSVLPPETTDEEENEQVEVEHIQPEKPKHQPIALLSDTIEYRITGTLMDHTLKEGETIIKLANRFYGSKKLWPYIANHNKDIIKDVDKVPVGTKLRIPKLSPR